MEGDGQQKIVDGGIPQQHQKPNKGQEKVPVKSSSNDGGNKNVKQLPEKNS